MYISAMDLRNYSETKICDNWDPQNQFSRVSTDTRTIIKGDLFLALSGEKFDGRTFIKDAIKAGAKVIVYQAYKDENLIRPLIEKNKNVIFIGVENSLKCLQWLGRTTVDRWRDENPDRRVICITGSNGKTTTKEMTYHLLDGILPGKVLKNYLNFNNHIGVPLTLLNLNSNHQLAVVEIGTNHPGEIAGLCEIADPDMGTITMIGESHLEFLIDKNGVYREKTALFEYIEKNYPQRGFFILNQLDPYLKNYSPSIDCHKLGEGDSRLKFEAGGVTVSFPSAGNDLVLKNEKLMGEYNFLNLVQAAILSLKIFPDEKKKIEKLAASFVSENNRSMWTTWKNKKVFLDAYNANPSSMAASLKEFSSWMKSQRVSEESVALFLGDMLELGEHSADYHKELGELVASLHFSRVYYFGSFGEDFKRGYGREMAGSYKSVDNVKSFEELAEASDVLFFKASRGLQLERLIR